MSSTYPLADRTLAERLERAEGDANRRFVQTRARVEPQSHAAWIDVEGTYAMFDGIESPLTQTFGLGMREVVTAPQLERIEGFFAERGATTFHEVSPLADASVLPLLFERGYQPLEFTSVMYQPLPTGSSAPPASRVRVRLASAVDHEDWARAAAEGWGESADIQAFIRAFGRVIAASTGALSYLAQIDGRTVATASMLIHEGIALLAGASTIPSGRRQGAQAQLLATRLEEAASRGCDVAMMCAQPGSGSQRNAERNGFRTAYSRLKWKRPPVR